MAEDLIIPPTAVIRLGFPSSACLMAPAIYETDDGGRFWVDDNAYLILNEKTTLLDSKRNGASR